MDVKSVESRVDKHSSKKKQKKFCTYQRHIILFILFLKKKERK